jgi:serine/threonine protein kinase
MLHVQFRKSNLLGTGAYGGVYSAQLGSKKVAVKRYLSSSTSFHADALRELVCMSCVPKHPHIMSLELAHIDERGRCCLVFPRLDGTLCARTKTFVPPDLVVKWSSQLICAVAHLHRHGFVHRDIKLENILLKDDNILLADFGMARFMPPFFERPPDFTANVCSLYTRPPELFLDAPTYDQRLDTWSVGCVMLALAAGKYVFRAENGSTMQSIRNIVGSGAVLQSLRTQVGRSDLPESFFDKLQQFLRIDYRERPFLSSFDTESKQPRLLQPEPFNPQSIQRETADVIGNWIWKIVHEFKLQPSTALFAYWAWVRSQSQSHPEAVLAAACCSLLCKSNESAQIPASTWAKTVGCKVKQLFEAEIQAVRATNGCFLSALDIDPAKYKAVYACLVSGMSLQEACINRQELQ